MKQSWRNLLLRLVVPALAAGAVTQAAGSRRHSRLENPSNALVVDAYELNTIDWDSLLSDKRIAAFISKASDGLPESFSCTGDHAGDTVAHCKTMWRKYAVSRELFQTRRLVARAAGLLWGSYHLARPGNPIDQANHFLEYADPKDDEMMILDLEGIDAAEIHVAGRRADLRRAISRRAPAAIRCFTPTTTPPATSPPTATTIRCWRGCRSGMRATSPT